MKASEELLSSMFDSIKIGHANAIKPPKNVQKSFDNYVNKKNSEGDLVIRTRRGYYRPFPMDDIDSSEFSKYIQSEYDRGMEIIDRCNTMTQLYSSIEKAIIKKWEDN